MPTSNSFSEMAHFGWSPAPLFAVLVIRLEPRACMMIFNGWLRGLDLKAREAS